MKKKYTYKFRDGHIEIETTEKWFAALREADRVESNNNITEQHKTIHYDAFGFEPDFMGQEDVFLSGSDDNPAFEYAMGQIPPKAREIITRRFLNHETNAVIGAALGVTVETVRYYIRRYLIRFRKLYEDGKWINSPANEEIPGSGKALTIPYKLSPEQVLAIRKLRSTHYSLHEIADIVKVAVNQVVICLLENPVDTTVCPVCGKLIHQSVRKPMHVFCDSACYRRWYRNSGADREAAFPPLREKTLVSVTQEIAMRYYKQMFISYKDMGALLCLPVRTISSYFNTKPLPFSLCAYCGERILYGRNHTNALNNRIVKFCSQKCTDAYYWRGFYAKAYKGIQIYHDSIIPFYDQLVVAMKWKISGFSDEVVCSCSGLPEKGIHKLFLYDDINLMECLTEEKLNNRHNPVIVTGRVRLIDDYTSSPLRMEGIPEIYAATLIIPSDDEKTITSIELAMEEAVKRGMPGLARPFPNREKVNLPFDKSQMLIDETTSQSYYFLHVSNYIQPEILDRKSKKLETVSITQNDDVAVEVEFFPYRINAKRYGIGCRFWVVQIIDHDESKSVVFRPLESSSYQAFLRIQFDIS